MMRLHSLFGHGGGLIQRLIFGLLLPLAMVSAQSAAARTALPELLGPIASSSDGKPFVVNARATTVAVKNDRGSPRGATVNDLALPPTVQAEPSQASVSIAPPTSSSAHGALDGGPLAYRSRAPPVVEHAPLFLNSI